MTPPTDPRLAEWWARSPFKDALDEYVLECAERYLWLRDQLEIPESVGCVVFKLGQEWVHVYECEELDRRIDAAIELRRAKRRKEVKIRHIGHLALCGARHRRENITRTDLGADRYRKLGVSERFKGEEPYRVCKRCLAKIIERERSGK